MRPRIRLPGLLVVLPGVALPAQAPVHRDEAQIMLFSLSLDRRQLAEVFPGYPGAGDGFLLPLGGLCQAVSLGIRVDARRGLAEGFIVEEKRRFRLDLTTGQLEIGGQAMAFDPAGVEWHEDDFYVDSRLLEAWLPMALKVDGNAATITVEPREKLPIEGAWEREERSGRPMANGADDRTKDFPVLPTPYSFLDLPFLDQTLSLANSRVDGQRRWTASGTTFATGDLLWMNGTGYFNSQSGHLVDAARLDLARRDPEAGLLGPLRAREVELGDLMNTGQPLLGTPILGRGVHLDNLPLNFQYSFERYAFRGNLLPGWSVELYQNDVLVGLQPSRADGLYEFRDVPTYFGVNDFKLVFYGPEGQRRVEWRRLDQRQALAPAGAFLYNLVAAGPSADPKQAASSRRQYLAEAAYGLSPRWDLRAMVTQVGTDVTVAPVAGAVATPAAPGQPNRFGALALQGFLGNVSLQLSGAANQDHGSMATLGVGTGLGYSSLTVRRSFLHSFDNPDFRATAPLKAHTQAQLVLMPAPGKGFPGSLNFDHTRDDLDQGGHLTNSSVRGALSFWNTSLSNTVTWIRSDVAQTQGAATPGDSTTGSLLLSQRIRQGTVRGQADYGLDAGSSRVRSYDFTGEYDGLRGYSLSAEAQRDIILRENRYQLAVNKFEGRVGLQAGLGWARSTSLTASLQLHLSLGRDPDSGRYFTQAAPLANNGAVSGRAFLDRNGNGRLDPGEPVLPGTTLQVDGSDRPGPLGEQAPMFQTGLYPSDYVALTLDTAGMEDPFIKPETAGVRILPRPGKVARVDFPMVVSGEINGIARMAGPKGSRDLAGLALELLDEKGRRVIAVRSSFDGFFNMPNLPPGRYQLRVLPEEAQRLAVTLPEPRLLEIKANGSIHEGILMKVVPLAAEDSAAPVTVARLAPGPGGPVRPVAPRLPPPPAALLKLVPPQPPAEGEPGSTLPAKGWTIQLGVFFDAGNLAKEKRALSPWAKELTVVPCPGPTPGQGYRLLMGRYPNRVEALQAARQLPAAMRRGNGRPFPVAIQAVPAKEAAAAPVAPIPAAAPEPRIQPQGTGAGEAGPATSPVQWTLQLGVFHDPAKLARERRTLSPWAKDLRVAAAEDPHGQILRLLMGHYPSAAEALQAARQLPAGFLRSHSRPLPVRVEAAPASVAEPVPAMPATRSVPLAPVPTTAPVAPIIPAAPRLRILPRVEATAETGLAGNPGPWTLQVGVFIDAANLARELRAIRPWAKDIAVEPYHGPVAGQGFCLLMGRYPSRAAAFKAAQQLPADFRRAHGRPFPVKVEAASARETEPVPPIPATQPLPAPPVAPIPASAPEPRTPTRAPAAAAGSSPDDGRWAIQLGVFYDAGNLAKRKDALSSGTAELRIVPFQDPLKGMGFRLLLAQHYAQRNDALRAIRQLPALYRQTDDQPFPIRSGSEASPRRLP